MEIKTTITAVFIYAAMICYVCSLLKILFGRNKNGWSAFAAGFMLNAAAICVRWIESGHFHIRTLFEIFLCLAAAIYPLSVCTKNKKDGRCEAGDVVIAIALLVPCGFVFSDESGFLPALLRSVYFPPHVGAYILGYVFMFKAAAVSISSLGRLKQNDAIDLEKRSFGLVRIGFVLLTLGLVTGCLWAKAAWGRFWGWDPKELWSLASWLAFALYFNYRFKNGTKHIAVNHLLIIAGAVLIVITLVWVNMSRIFAGLHNYT